MKNMKTSSEIFFDKLLKLEFPHQVLYGRGVVDINEHLNTLKEYSSKCNIVTEMGTRFGISVLSLLMGKPKKVISIDCNPHFFEPYFGETKKFADECQTEFEFIVADVLDMEISQTDLLFIDTLHTYNQLSKELRIHERKVNKWIILHDTVTFGSVDEDFYQNGIINESIRNEKKTKTGLYTAMIDFLEENKNWRIKEHFTNNNGLTILERV